MYAETYRQSVDDPGAFWEAQSPLVEWARTPHRILDDSDKPLFRWFPDGALNTCFNALDRHVRDGRGGQPALIYDSPVTATIRTLTYNDLLSDVAAFAAGLRDQCVAAGDRVIIYMPMVPEAVVAMLACARLGAVHSVVFGGFGAPELAARIDDAKPKVVVSASCGIEPNRIVEYKPLLDAALDLASHQVSACVLLQRPEMEAPMVAGRDLDWREFIDAGRSNPAACVDVAATAPLYILYTSGTTGKPKGVVRDNGGHAVAMAWSMRNIYDIGAGDVWWAASDLGWVVGHSYIVYGPLIAGATTVLYEGKPVGTPDAGAFWRVAAQHGVKGMFTAPTAIRAVKKEDPSGDLVGSYDLSRLRQIFLAGERLDSDTYEWVEQRIGVPAIDNWWQTETGWPIAANLRGLEPMPTKAGSPSVPVPGFDVQILDSAGERLPAGEEGAIVIKLPLPPGTLPTLWQDDDRYVAEYLSAFDGYYLSGDGGYVDEDGFVFVTGRTDDVINVAGHRLSTGAMEGVLATHHAVAECAVIGVQDALKGQVPRGFVVLKAGITTDSNTIADELIAKVRAEIGPVAAFNRVTVVDALPKTRSGKILRKTMREIADGGTPPVPSTIEDPDVLMRLRPLLLT